MSNQPLQLTSVSLVVESRNGREKLAETKGEMVSRTAAILGAVSLFVGLSAAASDLQPSELPYDIIRIIELEFTGNLMYM